LISEEKEDEEEAVMQLFSLVASTSSWISFNNKLFRSRENVNIDASVEKQQVSIEIIIFRFPV
jgi:hypothetical protein